MGWRILLDFDDFEDDAGCSWFWRRCSILMIMLGFDGLEDFAGF